MLLDDSACHCGTLRLMNGNVESQSEGRVEICFNDNFNTVCDDLWDDLDARVVCNELGFTGNGEISQAQTCKIW